MKEETISKGNELMQKINYIESAIKSLNKGKITFDFYDYDYCGAGRINILTDEERELIKSVFVSLKINKLSKELQQLKKEFEEL